MALLKAPLYNAQQLQIYDSCLGAINLLLSHRPYSSTEDNSLSGSSIKIVNGTGNGDIIVKIVLSIHTHLSSAPRTPLNKVRIRKLKTCSSFPLYRITGMLYILRQTRKFTLELI